MRTDLKTLTKTLVGAGALLAISITPPATLHAAGPVPLTDGELDHVSAGSALVTSSTDAQATGLNVTATTTSNSILGTNQGVEPGFGSVGGIASGSAVAWGLNPLGNSNGAPPPTSSTSVVTTGVAQGNFTLTIGGNATSSALGQTIQVGTTSVYGVLIPGL